VHEDTDHIAMYGPPAAARCCCCTVVRAVEAACGLQLTACTFWKAATKLRRASARFPQAEGPASPASLCAPWCRWPAPPHSPCAPWWPSGSIDLLPPGPNPLIWELHRPLSTAAPEMSSRPLASPAMPKNLIPGGPGPGLRPGRKRLFRQLPLKRRFKLWTEPPQSVACKKSSERLNREVYLQFAVVLPHILPAYASIAIDPALRTVF
jgi:hypothetical protein